MFQFLKTEFSQREMNRQRSGLNRRSFVLSMGKTLNAASVTFHKHRLFICIIHMIFSNEMLAVSSFSVGFSNSVLFLCDILHQSLSLIKKMLFNISSRYKRGLYNANRECLLEELF